MRLTENFTLVEFTRSDYAERHGIDNTVPYELLPNVTKLALFLQILRNRIKTHVIVTSGYRCPLLNTGIGGSSTSDHAEGLAADIRAIGYTPRELFDFIKAQMTDTGFDELILEFDSWVHVSVSPFGNNRREILIATKVINDGVTSTHYEAVA